jgi:N-acetylneuraminate synthase
MNKIKINDFVIGGGECYIIAEIGQAHDGSLGTAFAYIDAVAEAGVNAVKFQTHIANEESTKHEQFRVRVFPQDKTRYDYWKRMEFSKSQWKELRNYTIEKGLDFLSTPFSEAAVKLLDELDVPAFKVGSGDTTNEVLLDSMVKTGKPILISSGMSSYDELTNSIDKIKKAGSKCAVFQCTTSYPCNPEDIGYNVLEEFKSRYAVPVGLSDHSGTIFPSLASVALGVDMIEVHAVFSKRCFGPDTKSSLTIEELTELVKGVRFIEKGLLQPVDKNSAAEERAETKKIFSRSAFFIKDKKSGEILTADDFAMKKPGGGLDLDMAKSLIGRELKVNKYFDDYLTEDCFK